MQTQHLSLKFYATDILVHVFILNFGFLINKKVTKNPTLLTLISWNLYAIFSEFIYLIC